MRLIKSACMASLGWFVLTSTVSLGAEPAGASSTEKKPSTKPAVTKADHQAKGRYYDPEIGFSIVPPEGWKKGKPATPDVSFAFFGPVEEAVGVNFNVVVSPDEGPVDEKELTEALESEMRKIVDSWKLVRSGSTTLSGRPAFFFFGKFEFAGTEMRHFAVQIRGDQGRMFTVTFSALGADFPNLEKKFRASAKTILCD